MKPSLALEGKREAVRAVVSRYLQRPSPESVVVLVLTAGSKADDAWTERTIAVDFRPLTDDEFASWISRRAVAHGVTVTPGAGRTDTSSPLQHLWSAIAALWPFATAQIMFFGPNAASPPKNTFG